MSGEPSMVDETRIQDRLEGIELEARTANKDVAILKSELQLVKAEQLHMKELMEARLRIIDKQQDIMLLEMRQLAVSINTMGGNEENTPAGRSLSSRIASVRDTVESNEKKLSDMNRWQEQVNGMMGLLRWFGWAGLFSLGLNIAQLWLKMNK